MSEPFHRANKHTLGNWLVYNLLVLHGLRRAFGGLYVAIHPATRRLRGRGHTPYPIIFCLTHSGWFDGHIAAVLNRRIFGHDAYLMMEEANLARYFFFTWSGVFGIDRDNARLALASIEYISGILKEGQGADKALWMFPQGTMRHPDARPLKLYSGIASIARRLGKCAVVPVAIRYDFIRDQAPDAFVYFGPPLLLDPTEKPINAKELTNQLTQAMTEAADKLHADISAYNRQSYRRVLSGRGSVNKIWDGVMKIMGKRE